MSALDTSVPAAEEGFLRTLFRQLQEDGIRYAVMRNYDNLPYGLAGSDIDLLVDPMQSVQVRASIARAISLSNGVPIGVADSLGFFKVYILGKTIDEANKWWGVRLDINLGLLFKGVRLMDEAADWPIAFHNSIPVLSDGFAAVLGVLKDVLNSFEISPRYLETAREAARTDWRQISMLLSPMGSSALSRLRCLLLEPISTESMVKECKLVRRDVLLSRPFHQLPWVAWRRFVFEAKKIRRYFSPGGLVVAVLGVDGVGKSTVIGSIKPVLDAATHNAVVVRHLRPGVLPPLSQFRRAAADGPALPTVDPHGSPPSGAALSIFRAIYLLLDYVAGYWLWTRIKIAKEPTIIIFDRYAYDMGIDPRRFRIGFSPRFSGYIAALAPKPDLLVCLYGDAEAVAARKCELSLDETRRQMYLIQELARVNAVAKLISTDGSLEKARDEVIDAIFDRLIARRKML